MNIRKIINYTIQFENNSLCDVYLATSLYKYISEKHNHLEDYIGFSDENNPNGINDFLYSCSSHEKKIIKEIEENINEFLEKFDLVSEVLENQCEEELICDDVEFYEQFKKVSKILNIKQNLDKNLIKKDGKTKKLKL